MRKLPTGEDAERALQDLMREADAESDTAIGSRPADSSTVARALHLAMATVAHRFKQMFTRTAALRQELGAMSDRLRALEEQVAALRAQPRGSSTAASGSRASTRRTRWSRATGRCGLPRGTPPARRAPRTRDGSSP